MILMRRSRLLFSTAPLILALLGLWLLRSGADQRRVFSLLTQPTNHDSGILPATSAHDAALVPYWESLTRALLSAEPECSLPNTSIKAPLQKYAGLKKKSNKRPDLLNIPQQDVDDLRDAHQRYVSQLPDLVAALPYEKGTKGVVTTASWENLPVLVVSLRMLRRSGSKLPVQVYMQSRDVYYQKDVCETILPRLNATCCFMSDVLDKSAAKVKLVEDQMKGFALMFSSFDEVVWIDADNIAVEAPERLLDGEPFVEEGFVSWPDFWASTASPKYYEISSQPVPSVSELAASASSQLLISKTKHASTLLLALYYTYYGPSHYFTLLLQGAPGPASKEPCLAAATALDKTIYTVHTPPSTLGYHPSPRDFTPSGTVHHIDFQPHISHNNTSTPPSTTSAFLHAHPYPMDAAAAPEWFHAEISQRMWGPKTEMEQKFGGRDLEKQVWAETLYTGCHLQGSFRAWENSTDVCKRVGWVYKFLFD